MDKQCEFQVVALAIIVLFAPITAETDVDDALLESIFLHARASREANTLTRWQVARWPAESLHDRQKRSWISEDPINRATQFPSSSTTTTIPSSVATMPPTSPYPSTTSPTPPSTKTPTLPTTTLSMTTKSLEMTDMSGQTNVTSGQRNVTSGQRNVTSGQRNVTSGQTNTTSGRTTPITTTSASTLSTTGRNSASTPSCVSWTLATVIVSVIYRNRLLLY